MTPKEAISLVKKNPPAKGGYLMIELGYRKFLLPYAEGLTVLKALETAHMVDIPYASPAKLHAYELNAELTVHAYPPETLEAIRVSELLAISFTDALAAMRNILP